MFEEEYNDIIGSMQLRAGDDDYIRYLEVISAHDTHAGYFSVDKKGKMTDSKLSDKKEGTSDDIDAYDLIMKNKELLLDRDPKNPRCVSFSPILRCVKVGITRTCSRFVR